MKNEYVQKQQSHFFLTGSFTTDSFRRDLLLSMRLTRVQSSHKPFVLLSIVFELIKTNVFCFLIF